MNDKLLTDDLAVEAADAEEARRAGGTFADRYLNPADSRAPASSRLTDVLLSAAHFAAKFAVEAGVDLTSASIDLEDGRPEIYLVLDDFDGRLSVDQLEHAAGRLELDRAAEGEGWRQYSHEFDDVDVFLDVWSREPRSTRTAARSVRRYVRELAAASRRDPYLDVVLLSTAALGAAVALTARRAFAS